MKQYFRVPNKVFNLPLSSSETLVLIYLMRCSRNGDAFPSYVNIATSCKVTRITAINSVKKLEGKYLSVTRSNHDVNHYHITWEG